MDLYIYSRHHNWRHPTAAGVAGTPSLPAQAFELSLPLSSHTQGGICGMPPAQAGRSGPMGPGSGDGPGSAGESTPCQWPVPRAGIRLGRPHGTGQHRPYYLASARAPSHPPLHWQAPHVAGVVLHTQKALASAMQPAAGRSTDRLKSGDLRFYCEPRPCFSRTSRVQPAEPSRAPLTGLGDGGP
jgi:hypothetical protein